MLGFVGASLKWRHKDLKLNPSLCPGTLKKASTSSLGCLLGFVAKKTLSTVAFVSLVEKS